MKAIDIYLKIEADLDEGERADKFSEELCRMLKKIYGVRKAEVSNVHERSAE